jgi:hypothetical protein
VESPVDRDDVTAIIGGLFDANAKLTEIAYDVRRIRLFLEDDDEEEEEGQGDHGR